jgi:hypothetical protein
MQYREISGNHYEAYKNDKLVGRIKAEIDRSKEEPEWIFKIYKVINDEDELIGSPIITTLLSAKVLLEYYLDKD